MSIAYDYYRTPVRPFKGTSVSNGSTDTNARNDCGYNMAAKIGLAFFAFQVGTGGLLNLSYLIERGDKGYSYPIIQKDKTNIASATIKNPAQSIEHIKTVSGFSISELATVFGVSRQAIYDWQKGNPLSTDNLKLVSDLSVAMDTLRQNGVAKKDPLLYRPLQNGKNFLELVKNGLPATEAAEKLIKLVKREARERELLASHLLDRRLPDSSALLEAGIPILNESS